MDQRKLSEALNSLIGAQSDEHDHHVEAKMNKPLDYVAQQGGGAFEHMSMISPAFTPRAESPAGNDTSITSHSTLVERSLEDTLPEVFCVSRGRIPTTSGTEIFLHLYKNNVDNKEHLAIVFGEGIHSKTLFEWRPNDTEQDRMTRGAYIGKLWPGREKSDASEAYPPDQQKQLTNNKHDDNDDGDKQEEDKKKCTAEDSNDTLVRIHSECYTGETAWSARCDCGEQLNEAARLMAKKGKGVIVYLRQEGRGIGLAEKLKAYNLQDLGADTVQANLMLRHPADARSFSLATAILLDLGQSHIRLLTNNPDKIRAVEGKHKEIVVTERVPMVPLSWQARGGFHSAEVNKYLVTKVQRMGHLLSVEGIDLIEDQQQQQQQSDRQENVA